MDTDQKIAFIHVIDNVLLNLEKNANTYSWGEHESCNCGFLVQAACNLSPDSIKEQVTELSKLKPELEKLDMFDWSAIYTQKKYCQQTGLSLGLVFKRLEELGLTGKDIVHLEYLSDPDILEEMDMTWPRRGYFIDQARAGDSTSEMLRDYLKAWKLLLEKEVVCSKK